MQNNAGTEKWDYIIDGKQNGLAGIIIFGVLAAIFAVLTIDQLKPSPDKYLFVAMIFAEITLIFLIFVVFLSVRYFFLKIYIGKSGFYFQTNPFNGRYYKYSETLKSEEKLVVERFRAVGYGNRRRYKYYFIFVLKNGESKKVQFDKAVHEKEFNVLQERINNK